jgi:succinate dehydrogenase / fumarate reductase iron-sulfur subunit
VAFDHDCREGICGSCGMMINGMAHGPRKATTTCQLHMREFPRRRRDLGRAVARQGLPGVKDLVVDRGALDRIVQSGGYISVRTGSAPDANEIRRSRRRTPTSPWTRRSASAAAPAWPPAPTRRRSLFTAAKIAHLSLVPQGQPERADRVRKMVAQHDAELFGSCTQHGECEAACPKGISIDFIARMNRDHLAATLTARADLPPRGK